MSKQVYSDKASNKQRKFKYTEYHVFFCECINQLSKSNRLIGMKLYCANNDNYYNFKRDDGFNASPHNELPSYLDREHPDVWIHFGHEEDDWKFEGIKIGYV